MNTPSRRPLDTSSAPNAASPCTSEPMRNCSPGLRKASASTRPSQSHTMATRHIVYGRRARHQTPQLWVAKSFRRSRQSHFDQRASQGMQGTESNLSQLVQLFGTQVKGSQGTTGHNTQPAPSTPHQPSTPAEGFSPPAPKKLRFSDEVLSEEAAPLAMTPSPPEQAEEETVDDDPTIEGLQVDYF